MGRVKVYDAFSRALRDRRTFPATLTFDRSGSVRWGTLSPVVPVCSTVYPIAPLDHGPDALQPPGMETPTTAEAQEGNHSESAVLKELVRRPLEDIAREVATLRAQKAALTAETERLTTLMPVPSSSSTDVCQLLTTIDYRSWDC